MSAAEVVAVPAVDDGPAWARVALLVTRGRAVVVTVDPQASVDLATVDLLARLVLAARRSGGCLVVDPPHPGLRRAAALLGLREALGL
ncbi:STAS domain-containing protein [Geodermatophilus telluris]|uniref:STAS domain-containing protein n=1 Tax=Geodermatophilus telluris TaxID=1190417 RepID=A0A1G6JHY5_9ACTN|nr:STAS domain-containing protein [Geodermatophilus telluris]SDC18291.1 STAS domain-containing protein [Geodermatophilus telluris]